MESKQMLFAIHIYSYKGADTMPVMISSATDFHELWFFQRKIARDCANHNSRTIAFKSKPAAKMCIDLKCNMTVCYVINSPLGLCATLIAYKKYTDMYGIVCLNEILGDFIKMAKTDLNKLINQSTDIQYNPEFLERQLEKWQDPEKNDKMLKIQKSMDSILGNLMRKTLIELIGSEEQIEQLIEQSKDMNSISIDFYKQAKKSNQCCKYT